MCLPRANAIQSSAKLPVWPKTHAAADLSLVTYHHCLTHLAGDGQRQAIRKDEGDYGADRL